MKRRFLAMLLCLCLVTVLLPVSVLVATTVDAPAGTITNSEMLEPNMDPGEDWENDKSNPYGTNEDQPFSLNTINELVFYTNQETTDEISRKTGGGIFNQDYVVDKSQANSMDGNYNVNDTIVYRDSTAFSYNSDMGYVCGVAFDPYGTGRADHAAYVGLYSVDGVTYSGYWLQNLKTGESTPVTKLEVVPDWGGDYMLHYQARDFLNITAGDYNGNGKETVMLTVPGYNNIIAMNTPATQNYSKACTVNTNASINSKSYAIDWGDAGNNMKAELAVSLATGDFDRDGVDELAVSAGKCYTADSAATEDLAYMNNYTTWLTIFNRSSEGTFVALGEVNRQCLLTYDSSKDEVVNISYGGETALRQLNLHHYNNIRFASISAGDVNGDGYDDVVVAGYLGDISREFSMLDGVDYDYYTAIGSTQNKIAYATYYGGSNTVTEVSTMDMNTYTAEGTPSKMEIRPALAVACAALDGYGTADYVFIAGTVYSWKADGTANQVFQTQRAGTNGVRKAQRWYDSAAVGNFDGNSAGREQIVAVIYEKSANNQYYDCYVDTIGGYAYDDVEKDGEVTSYGPAKSLYSTASGAGQVIDGKYSNTDKDRMSCFVLAADVDDDGVLVKYETKCFGYSDAQVQAVLQAAPYFGELGDYDEDFSDGSTAYSISSGYTDTTSSSNSVSFGAAFVTEHSFKVYKFDIHAGITVDWTETYEQSLSVEYSSEFSAGGDDTVVLYRIPATTYYYSVYNEDTKKFEYDEKNARVIVVPETPVYTTMDKASYNKFAQQYNEKYKDQIADDQAKPLPLITEEVLPDATGNPFSYWSNYGKVTVPGADTLGSVSGFVSLSDSPKQLGTGSSSITNGWTKSEEFSKGTETSVGFAVSTTHQWGTDDHSAGFELSFGYSHAWGKVYTSMESMGASGTVNSLDRGALERNYGIPANITDQYNFTWDFGMRTWTLSEYNSVPIFGYVLTSLRAGSPHPTDLSAKITALDTVKLEWTVPETSATRPYDGLNLWRSKDGGSYEKINAEPLGVDETSYSVSGLDSNTPYSFVVTSTYAGSDGAFSPAATVTMPKQNYKLTYSGSNTDISASYLGDIIINSGASVAEESIVFVTATPKTGYTITGVTLTSPSGTENVTLVDGKFNFVLRGDTTIKVTTAAIVDTSELTLEQPADGGSFTASVDGMTVSGDTVTVVDPIVLSATPKNGYVLKAWLVDGNPIASLGINTKTFTPYQTTHTISALFVEKSDPSVNVTLTVSAGNGGALEIKDASGAVLTPDSGSLSLLLGTQVTVTAKPNNYYTLLNWTGALSDYSKNTRSVTFSVTEAMAVGASFYAPIKYPVSFSAGANGTLSAAVDGEAVTGAKVNVVPGSNIAFTAKADDGYRISGWTVTGFGAKTVSYADRIVTSDTLNLSNLTAASTVRANFTDIKTYDLTFDPGNGEGTPYTVHVNELTKYALPANTFTAPESMVFSGWQIGQSSYRPGVKLVFDEDTTITALWRPSFDSSTDNPFTDVKESDWFFRDVMFVYENELMLGTSATTFSPNDITTRAMLATILWRMEGSPEVTGNSGFADVSDGKYYTDAVTWAKQNDIVKGYSNTLFGPNDPVTREQMAAILYRYAQYKSYDTTISSNLSGFKDKDKVSDWAVDAMKWTVGYGIIQGLPGNLLYPQGNDATRAQLAAMLHRLIEKNKQVGA